MVGKEWYRDKLKHHEKRFIRCHQDKRALNKWIKNNEFFERYAAKFDTLILFNKKENTFSYKKIKIEEDRTSRDWLIPVGAHLGTHFLNTYLAESA
jgi:hypothetical protein